MLLGKRTNEVRSRGRWGSSELACEFLDKAARELPNGYGVFNEQRLGFM